MQVSAADLLNEEDLHALSEQDLHSLWAEEFPEPANADFLQPSADLKPPPATTKPASTAHDTKSSKQKSSVAPSQIQGAPATIPETAESRAFSRSNRVLESSSTRSLSGGGSITIKCFTAQPSATTCPDPEPAKAPPSPMITAESLLMPVHSPLSLDCSSPTRTGSGIFDGLSPVALPAPAFANNISESQESPMRVFRSLFPTSPKKVTSTLTPELPMAEAPLSKKPGLHMTSRSSNMNFHSVRAATTTAAPTSTNRAGLNMISKSSKPGLHFTTTSSSPNNTADTNSAGNSSTSSSKPGLNFTTRNKPGLNITTKISGMKQPIGPKTSRVGPDASMPPKQQIPEPGDRSENILQTSLPKMAGSGPTPNTFVPADQLNAWTVQMSKDGDSPEDSLAAQEDMEVCSFEAAVRELTSKEDMAQAAPLDKHRINFKTQKKREPVVLSPAVEKQQQPDSRVCTSAPFSLLKQQPGGTNLSKINSMLNGGGKEEEDGTPSATLTDPFLPICSSPHSTVGVLGGLGSPWRDAQPPSSLTGGFGGPPASSGASSLSTMELLMSTESLLGDLHSSMDSSLPQTHSGKGDGSNSGSKSSAVSTRLVGNFGGLMPAHSPEQALNSPAGACKRPASVGSQVRQVRRMKTSGDGSITFYSRSSV